jgi:cell division protein FtsX
MNPRGLSLLHGPTGQASQLNPRNTAMNFNIFSVIAASAISATVALPASANVEISDKKAHTQSYTQKYLQQSANFYAALDHKTQA